MTDHTTTRPAHNATALALCRRLHTDYISKHRRLLIVMVGLLIAIAATTTVQPLLLQVTFDKVFTQKDQSYLTIMPLAIAAIIGVQALATYYSSILMTSLGGSVIADMRTTLVAHIIENDIEFYSSHASGNLLTRVASETKTIAAGVQHFFNTWIKQAVTAIGLVLVMIYQSAELTILAVLAFSLSYHPITQITKRLKKLVRQFNDAAISLNSRLLESFEGIRVIKAFAKEDNEVSILAQYIVQIKRINDKLARFANLTPLLMQTLAGIAIAFVISYGGAQLIQGKLTQGELIAFITSLLMLSKPVKALTSATSVMTTALVNSERYYALLDITPQRPSRHDGEFLHVTSGAIAFDGVRCVYPNGTVALKDATFTIQAKRRTALVGQSGSGKSTVFNLLLRFYDATSGTIRIDGDDITEASISSVRRSIALVSQEIFIFDDTARNNIAYGREGAMEDEIIAAAKAARCHDFIAALPKQYETRLGYSGQTLSGGQKQRIAIARAFLRQSPILFLDEATSSLDPRTEAEIQEALEVLTRDRTTVIIAHRLSTVMSADDIIVMEDGEIKGNGSHQVLLETSALYRQLFGL